MSDSHPNSLTFHTAAAALGPAEPPTTWAAPFHYIFIKEEKDPHKSACGPHPHERLHFCRFTQLHLKQTLWHVGRFSCWLVSWPQAFKVWCGSQGMLHIIVVCEVSLEPFLEIKVSWLSVHIFNGQQLWGGRSGARNAGDE